MASYYHFEIVELLHYFLRLKIKYETCVCSCLDLEAEENVHLDNSAEFYCKIFAKSNSA